MENRKREIIIREAIGEDLNRISEIYSQHFGHTEPAISQWWKIQSDNNIQYIVATIDDNVVGVSSLITINKLIRSGNRVALIEDVAVDEKYIGYGVGKEMIEYLKELALTKKCYKTILNCSDENIGFYEKCGFYRSENQMRWDRPK